jgi:hypothetical protein
VESYQAGDFKGAAEKLEKSYRVLKAPSLGLWSARALVKLDLWVEASERYREVLNTQPSGGDMAVQKQAQAEAESELEGLSPKIPTLVLKLEGASAAEVQATIDGKAVAPELLGAPTPLNPGAHAVVALRGSERQSLQVQVAAGDEKTALLRFSGKPLAAPNPTRPVLAAPNVATHRDDPGRGSVMRSVGWAAIVVGGAGLAAGGITGALALGKKSSIDDAPECHDNVCTKGAGVDATVNGYNTLRTVSTVGFVAGGVLAATGVVLVLAAPRPSEQSTALWISPSAAGMRVRF